MRAEFVWLRVGVAAPIEPGTGPESGARRRRSRDGKTRILRVVTLEDEETIHNAFFDRDFEDKAP
jgi:hypothetical protein